MGAVKFEGVDVLDFLGKVVELHTQHYKDDFDIDKELIQNLAACRNHAVPAQKRYYPRLSGGCHCGGGAGGAQ